MLGKKLELTNKSIDMAIEEVKANGIFYRIYYFVFRMDRMTKEWKFAIKRYDRTTIANIQEEIKGYEKTKRERELNCIG